MLVMPVKSGLLRRVAHEHLRVLSERTGETAQLGIRVGYNVAFIDQVESPQKIRYVANLRERRPLLTTSMGKIFLASMDDATLRKFLNNRALDDQAAVARFLKEMKQIRQEGVSFNREESVEGVYAVGAGIRNESSGPIIAAVSVAGPAFRMTPHLACTTDEVSRVARAISESLTQRSWS
jgi:DNA-binding IclR family transcriptional regulator